MLLGSSEEACSKTIGCLFSRSLTLFAIPAALTLVALAALVATNILSAMPLAITAVVMGSGILAANLVNGPKEVDETLFLRGRSRWIEFLAQTIGSVALIILSALALKNVLSFSALGYTVIGVVIPSYLASGILSAVDVARGH